jgi:Type II secretion system (T2SS), protein G
MTKYWRAIGLLAVTLVVAWFCWVNVFHVYNGVDSRAKMDVRYLETALQMYHEKNKNWPEDLEKLTEPPPDGRAALLEKGFLIDPWRRPYQYDPNQLHPTTGIPRVWSDGPDPGNPDKKIANW